MVLIYSSYCNSSLVLAELASQAVTSASGAVASSSVAGSDGVAYTSKKINNFVPSIDLIFCT